MPTYILGISAFYHDSAAALLRDGDIVAAAQEERFSRKKHDHRFPLRAIRFCLDKAGIGPADLNHVTFYDKPWIKFERLLETYLAFAPAGLPSFLKSMPLWLKDKLWMEDMIRAELGGHGWPLYFPEHHQSHAASAFYPSPFETAAVLTMDGVGEWATTTWGVGAGNTLEGRCEIRFPHSLGLLYSAVTYYTGFKVNSGEYKVMGLAPYGEPRYAGLLRDKIIEIKDDGSYRLDMDYFNYCQGLTMTSERFHELFGGPPRQPESRITHRDMDMAASVQAITEEIVLKTARHIRKMTGERRLCMAGGVALNCVANGKLLRERIFDELWIQPAAGDAGGSLGAAMFVWHQVLGNERKVTEKRDRMRGAHLGPEFPTREIEAVLNARGIPFELFELPALVVEVARLLAEGRIVGWFHGPMEFGPRSLGARSILGDPRRQDMQATMNLKVKFRESFRPFAPACAVEDAREYFDIDVESPYMLLVAPVREERRLPFERGGGEDMLEIVRRQRSDIPAVTHLDYSARLQTVHREDNPAFHQLLREFRRQTGCGVLVNTSFNVRGEPIVCTPEDAYRCFMRTEIDALVLQDLLLRKAGQPAFQESGDWKSEYELD
jgi:carbamoyltransferase